MKTNIATKPVLAAMPEYRCTSCGGDATMAYTAETIKRGKLKGQQRASWDGLVQPNERICLVCGRKRGIKFF